MLKGEGEGHWEVESRFRTSDVVLAIEQWSGSKPSAGSSMVHGGYPIGYMCFADLEKTFREVCEGCFGRKRYPLIWAIQSLYYQCWTLVHISGHLPEI